MIFLQISFFLSLFIIILGGAHYLFYLSLIRFFSITSYNYKVILTIILFFLAISFIVALISAHWKENSLTRICYFLSGFWLGLLANLLIASLLIWTVFGFSCFFNLNINLKLFSAIFFIIAFFISIWGIRNAINPKIKNISVTIQNLPANWKNKKIVQLSDVHMGLLYHKNFLENVVAKINPLHPELVLITGDFFDGMDGNLDSMTSPLKNLQTTKGVFFIAGNHETYLGTNNAFSALKKTNIQILQNQVIDVDGIKIIGIGYPERNSKQDNMAILKNLKSAYFGMPNILLYHSPTNIKQFAENGIDLQLSGHTHLGQLFPFNLITKLIYHGFDYGLHKIKNYTLYTSSGVGTWGPMMRTNSTSEIVVITLQ